MLIKNRQGWELPDSAATPEALFFGRRELLKGAGIAAFAGVLAGCDNSPSAAAGAPAAPAPADDPSAALYPFKRNPKYTLDRPLTPANIVSNYNNYYEFGDGKDDPARLAGKLQIRPWQISIEGMVEKPFKVDFDTLMKAMPMEERLYRHRCVETWSFAVPWSGFPLKALVDYAKPMSGATYVEMKTFQNPAQAPGQRVIFYPWPYTEGLTIAEATNDMAFMVTGAYGKPLPKQNGAPLRLATPWKYGFKSIKGIQRIIFTNQRPKSYWQALTPSEYGFWANINPAVPHPRWSQESEWLLDANAYLGTGVRVPTKLYNGYADQVASLYANIKGEQLFR